MTDLNQYESYPSFDHRTPKRFEFCNSLPEKFVEIDPTAINSFLGQSCLVSTSALEFSCNGMHHINVQFT